MLDHDMTICISTDFGELEGVPANVTFEIDAGQVTFASINSANPGTQMSHEYLVGLVGDAEVERQEELARQEIQAALDAGDFDERLSA